MSSALADRRERGIAAETESPPALGADMRGDRARAALARARLTIDLGAISHNLEVIRRLAGSARVMAVIKGDAYGLGADRIGEALQAGGVEAFAVDNVAEGIALREAGIVRPILIIDGDVADNAMLAVRYRLCPAIPNRPLLVAYQQAAAAAGVLHPVWLVANVGFNRSGPRELDAVLELCRAARGCVDLDVRAICAHLSNSSSAGSVTEGQIHRFEQQVAVARGVLGPIESSLWASHGLAGWRDRLRTEWVRIGILLYGEHGFAHDAAPPGAMDAVRDLVPALGLQARITQLLDFDGPQGVGYGQHHRVAAGTRLATVSFGFGGGFPPGCYEHEVLVHGRRARTAGPIGMDALQIDVTGRDDVALGDWVTLLGRDGEGGDVASLAGLVKSSGRSPYEILRALDPPRVYINEEHGRSDRPGQSGESCR